MDDWTYSHPDLDADAPPSQPMLLDQVWGAVEDRLRAAHADAAAQAEADRRAAELEQARAWEDVDDGRSVLDVPLPFEAPARTSPPTDRGSSWRWCTTTTVRIGSGSSSG